MTVARLTMISLLVHALSFSADAKKEKVPEDILEWAKKITGQEFWLRTDVIRIQGSYKATDATNVYPDGRIYYQGTISKGVQINSQSVAEFTAEARRKLGFDKGQNAATILTMQKGAQVLIHEIEAKASEIKVKLTLKGDWYASIQTTIRLKLRKGYDLTDAQRLFDVAFAGNEYEVKHADSTDELTAGMSMVDVTAILGLPDTKISLDSKTLLVYQSLKLIFMEGELIDAQ